MTILLLVALSELPNCCHLIFTSVQLTVLMFFLSHNTHLVLNNKRFMYNGTMQNSFLYLKAESNPSGVSTVSWCNSRKYFLGQFFLHVLCKPICGFQTKKSPIYLPLPNVKSNELQQLFVDISVKEKNVN